MPVSVGLKRPVSGYGRARVAAAAWTRPQPTGIRVSDAIYDQVFSLFTDTLQLPISWDVHNYYPPFKAGGVVAGNISMEIFRSGEQPLYPSQAQIYGIALEATPLIRVGPICPRRRIDWMRG